jgi:hypothetical protein
MNLTRFFKTGLALTVSASLSTPVWAITTYDGTYKVDVTTDEGDCQKTATGTVTVADGIIVETSDSAVQTFGRVGEEGIVSFAFHRGTDVAHISGRLKGGRFQGAWSAPEELCGGRWTAQKVH